MNDLLLEARFANSTSPFLKQKLVSSGFLGKKKDLIYFSPNLMFFSEDQILAQIILKENHSLVVRPVKVLEMHYQSHSGQALGQNRVLQFLLKSKFEKIIVGDIFYFEGFKVCFSVLALADTIHLSKV